MILCIDDAESLVPLADFERQFWYPLGPANSFRIEHGDDYTLFFRAMGRAVTFYEQNGEGIRGVISVVLRSLRTPTGDSVQAAYFCDLKVLPSARGGSTAARLLQRSARWALEYVPRAFAVVMGGTASSPTRYTGRVGIPDFQELGQFTILRIPVIEAHDCGTHGTNGTDGTYETEFHKSHTSHLPDAFHACRYPGANAARLASLGDERDEQSAIICPVADARSRFASLSSGIYSPQDGNPELRSEMEPSGIITRSGSACGVLEDTRRAKRLYDRQGNEMFSAHLSSLAFQKLEDAVTLIRGAMCLCRQQNIPALFLAVCPDQVKPLLAMLGIANVVQAEATVFGHGFPAMKRWYVSTSEI